MNGLWNRIMGEISKNRNRNNILKRGSKNLNLQNWAVYHPNGTHMFTCGERKATWYLDKGLAKITSEGKIMLTFTPKGGGFDSGEIFGKTEREVICVVSGTDEGLQRHHIVPYCYRTYFPEEYKAKNHHDVVLINHELHSEYEQQANVYKDKIADIYGVKTITEFNIEYTHNLRDIGRDGAIITNSIKSILNTYGRLPHEDKSKKLELISKISNIPIEVVNEWNYIQLYKFYTLVADQSFNAVDEFKKNHRIYYDHGYHVVKQLDTQKKMTKFIKLWRKHFINTMNPKFMPKGWSIDFRVKSRA